MAAENPLTKLPLAGQLGVSLVLAILIGVGFYYGYYEAANAEEATKAKRLADLRDDIRRLEAVANKLEEFKREVQIREAKLEQLKQVLPNEKQTADLMRKVQYLAAQSNLTIKRFNPGNTVNKDFYQEWPINVEVEGNYHNLALFFDRVGRLPRLVNAGTLTVRNEARPTVSKTMRATLVATTYVYTGRAEAAPKPGAKPAGRR
ncbi:MAG: type 4a pilus biogenesis protein PilO [Vicinamibacteria bacterium]